MKIVTFTKLLNPRDQIDLTAGGFLTAREINGAYIPLDFQFIRSLTRDQFNKLYHDTFGESFTHQTIDAKSLAFRIYDMAGCLGDSDLFTYGDRIFWHSLEGYISSMNYGIYPY